MGSIYKVTGGITIYYSVKGISQVTCYSSTVSSFALLRYGLCGCKVYPLIVIACQL